VTNKGEITKNDTLNKAVCPKGGRRRKGEKHPVIRRKCKREGEAPGEKEEVERGRRSVYVEKKKSLQK